MLTRDEAIAAAEEHVKAVIPEKADSIVMLPEKSTEYRYGWTVVYDFKEHIETGDRTLAPFSPLVVVPHDGSAPHGAPTYMPSAQYMELRASGNWPPT